jgi:serralysin
MTKLTQSVLQSMLALGLTVGVTSAPAANTAGTLDPTFGINGFAIASAASGVGIVDSMVLQSDGKILVLVLAGSNNVVFRFTANGALDTSFGSNGMAVLSPPVGGTMTLQANGQILIAGVVTNASTGVAELGLERLNTDGTPNTFFGSDGLATASLNNRAPGEGFCLLPQPNGDILMGTQLVPAGRRAPTQTILARFFSTGAADTTFGSNGTEIVTAPSGCTAVALLSTGKFLVVDSEAIAQFTANGAPEATVTGGTVVATSGSNQNGVANLFQANGDYLFLEEIARLDEVGGDTILCKARIVQ